MKKKLFYKIEKVLLQIILFSKKVIFIIYLQFALILFLYILFYEQKSILKKKKLLKSLNGYKSSNLLIEQIKLDYNNNRFAIIRENCKSCGLFVFHNHYLGCIVSFIKEGYIPIVDLVSFPNIFNGFHINSSNKNPWEFFFNQPYGYTLEGVKKNSKNIKYFKCKNYTKPYKYNIYINGFLAQYGI